MSAIVEDMVVQDVNKGVGNQIPRIGGRMKKKRIRDKQGVQELCFAVLHEIKADLGQDTFQAPLAAIAERIRREPKPSASTVLRACQELAAANRGITMVKDEKNPRGPYTFTVEGYVPRMKRAVGRPRKAIAEKVDEVIGTKAIPEPSDINRRVEYIFARRAELKRELDSLDRMFQRMYQAISSIPSTPGHKVARSSRRRAVRKEPRMASVTSMEQAEKELAVAGG